MSDKYLNLAGLGTLWAKIKTALAGKQDDLSAVLPTDASATNQLATKAYADAIGERLEARYLGSAADGSPFATHAALTSATAYYYQGAATTPDTNDITTVTADEDHIGTTGEDSTTRYRWNGTGWAFEYVINNTGLSEAQLMAVNSGITAAKVSGYDGLSGKISDEASARQTADNAKLNIDGTNATNTGIGTALSAISTENGAFTDTDYFVVRDKTASVSVWRRKSAATLWTYLKTKVSAVLTAGLDLKIENDVIQVNANPKSGATQGNWAFVEGDGTEASGNSSHAEGGTTTASAPCAHSEGCKTTASGNQAHAEGYGGTASGENSHVEGAGTVGEHVAYGTSSHAEGGASNAWGKDSHAEGYRTTTREYKLKDGGVETTVSDWEPQPANTTQYDTSFNIAQHSEGWETLAAGIAAHAEGMQTKSLGLYSHAEGQATTATGTNCHAEGYATTAAGLQSHAEGYGTTAYGTNCHAEGRATTALGQYSHAEGESTAIASGTNSSHAEGYMTYVNGNGCHGEGHAANYKNGETTVYLRNEVTGQGCHAEGNGTKASGYGSHAEGSADFGGFGDTLGQMVQASAIGTHAEGIATTANNPGAHAEGISCISGGYGSHAEGKYTIAASNYQHVVGQYNVNDGSNTYAEIVGGGTSHTARKNIRTLDWSGNETLAGTLKAPTVSSTTVKTEIIEGTKPGSTTNYLLVNSAMTVNGDADLKSNVNLGENLMVVSQDDQKVTVNGDLSVSSTLSIGSSKLTSATAAVLPVATAQYIRGFAWQTTGTVKFTSLANSDRTFYLKIDNGATDTAKMSVSIMPQNTSYVNFHSRIGSGTESFYTAQRNTSTSYTVLSNFTRSTSFVWWEADIANGDALVHIVCFATYGYAAKIYTNGRFTVGTVTTV